MNNPMIEKLFSLLKSNLDKNLYRRSFLVVLLVSLLFAAWKISAKLAWENTFDKRAEHIYQREKQRYEFEKNYGTILTIQQVLSNESNLLNRVYEAIFYFFIPPNVEFIKSETFLESLKLLEYLFDRKSLSPEKYTIFVCGDTNVISKFDFLVNDMNFKFVKPALVNKNVYEQLSLPEDGYALIITNRHSQTVWCSMPPPKETTYAKIIEKLVIQEQ
jgi:hypothetical protein